MATHARIFEFENAIIDLEIVVKHAQAELAAESKPSGGPCYPENSDVWGTLAVNASVLALELNRLAVQISVARGKPMPPIQYTCHNHISWAK